MTAAASLTALLTMLKDKYIESTEQEGGTAPGFREFVRKYYSRDKSKFIALVLDAIMEATTKKWEEQPRKTGPDLFSIADETIPEFLTRPAAHFVDGDDDERTFEKVSFKFATVRDLHLDALIKMRKAAQSSAAAERMMRAADEARRRAGGRDDVLLKTIQDT